MADLPALDDPAILVEAFEQVVRNALAPVLARLKQAEAIAADVRQLESRVGGIEAAAPVPGPPGSNGQGLERVEYDGERTVTFAWGATQVPIRMPGMIYRGVYVAGKQYERGDCVTVGGSVYHANTDTATRPGELAQAWTLAVKQGRDVPR